MGTHPIFESDFDCLTEMGFGRLVVNSLFTSVIIVLFVTSGLIVNALWTIILPLWFAGRRDLYRACCKHITTAWFRIIIFIPLVWGKCKFKVYSDDATETHAGKEVGICIANHRYTNDWILDFIAAEQYSMLGQCKAFIKSEIGMIPFLGWAMWFNEFGFLTRAKASKDLKTLQRASEHFREYTEPCWLLLYPEGTRFTKEKHEASIEFAREKQIQPMRQHLIPRPKGFHELTTSLKNSNVKAMYDCTFYVENDFDVSIAHWLKGNPSTISLVCSRIDLSEIPTDPDESKAYLYQLFHEKDEIIEKMMGEPNAEEFVFENSKVRRQPIRRRPTGKHVFWKPFISTAIWFMIIMVPILRICLSYATSSFTGFFFTVGGIIAMNMVVLYMLNFALAKSSYGKKKN